MNGITVKKRDASLTQYCPPPVGRRRGLSESSYTQINSPAMNTSTSFFTSHTATQGPPSLHKKERIAKPISPREREVLHLIAYEYSTKEIASELYLSTETINSHRKNIMRKLNVKNAAGMVRVAFEQQLLQTA